MADTALSMWTVYDVPTDYPGLFVARRYTVTAGRVEVTDDVKTSETLIGIREIIVTETGCTACIGRSPGDDPVIVETWP